MISEKQYAFSKKKNQKRKSLKMKITFLRILPKFLLYARQFAFSHKPRSQYQNLLFPNSNQKRVQNKNQLDQNIYQTLSEQYKQYSYPFFLSDSNFFIQDQHLNVIQKLPSITKYFSDKKYGQAIIFGELIDEIGSIQDPSIQKIFWKDFIVVGTSQNYVIMINLINKKTDKFKIEVPKKILSQNKQKSQFFIKQIKMNKDYLFVLTDFEMYILKFEKKSSKQEQKIQLFYTNKFHKNQKMKFLLFYPIIRINQHQTIKNEIENRKIQLICLKQCTIEKQLTQSNDKNKNKMVSSYYSIVNLKIKKGIFNSVQQKQLICTQNTQIIAFKCKYVKTKIHNHIKQFCLIVYATKKGIQIICYDLKKQKISFQNKLRRSIYYNNTQKDFLQQLKIQFFQSQIQNQQLSQSQLKSKLSESQISQNQQNIFRQSLKQQNDQYQYLMISYQNKIFPYKISVSKKQIKQGKRIKINKQKIVQISKINNKALVIVSIVQDKQDFFKFEGKKKSQQQKKIYMNKNVSVMSVYITLIGQIFNSQQYVIFESIPKFSINFLIPKQSKYEIQCKIINNFSHGKQILILLRNQIQNNIRRIKIKSWKQIYLNLYKTSNIQLLKFLILSKKYVSPFLVKPSQQIFQNQKIYGFFPIDNQMQKLIMLEYYQQINIEPLQSKINLKQQPLLLIPFILNHSINNIPQQTLQFIVQYWIKRDQRIVQQIIIGGAEYGWDFAVKRGWIRALQKMVQMGAQIDLPILKLFSFILALYHEKSNQQILSQSKIMKQQKSVMRKLKKKQKISYQNDFSIGNINFQDFQSVNTSFIETNNKISYYCKQIIQYSNLILKKFLKPPFNENQKKDQLFLFYKAILNTSLFDLLIFYQPKQCTKLVSMLFLPQQKIQILDSFNMKEFINCNRIFKQIVISNNHSICQMVLSHISLSFISIIQKKFEQQQQKSKKLIKFHSSQQRYDYLNFSLQENQLNEEQNKKQKQISLKQIQEQLMIQHAILFDRKIFQFTNKYKKQILYYLIQQSNAGLLKLFKIKSDFIQQDQYASQDDLQFCMQEFLQDIWLSIYDSEQLSQKQIKDMISQVEIYNDKNNYLIISMMRKLDNPDYSKKIFKKYLQSNNKIIKRKVFDWVDTVLAEQQGFDKQVIDNLKHLIQIDKKLSRHLFNVHFNARQIQIITRIDNDKALQLEYIQLIVKDHQQNQLQLDQQYTNLHIRLLLQLDPQKVIYVLQSTINYGSKNTSSNNTTIKYNLVQILKMAQQIQQKIKITLNPSYKLNKNYSQFKNFTQSYIQQITNILAYLYQKTAQIEKSIQKRLQLIYSIFKSMIILDQKIFLSINQDQNAFSLKQDHDFDIMSTQQQQIQLFSKQSNYFGITSNSLNNKDKSNQMHFILQTRFKQTFQQIIYLIFKQLIIPYSHFFNIFRFFNELMKQIKSSKYMKKNYYIFLIKKQMGFMIVEMFQRGYSCYFVDWINGQTLNMQQNDSSALVNQVVQRRKYSIYGNESKNINNKNQVFNQMKKYILYGYYKLHSQIVFLQDWVVIDIKVLLKNVNQTIGIINKGVSILKKTCNVCNQQFEDEAFSGKNNKQDDSDALLFTCGHIYHIRCFEPQNGKDFCWQCGRLDNFKMMIQNKEVELVNLLQRYSFKKLQSMKSKMKGVLMSENNKKSINNKLNDDIKVKNDRKKKMNRLNIFDKKINTLRREDEIIEMKMRIQQYYNQTNLIQQ